MSRSGYYIRYFTPDSPGSVARDKQMGGAQGRSGLQRTDAGLSGGSWDVPWEPGSVVEYQQHIQIFHFMFYVDKSRG